MPRNAELSVVIPAHNAAKFLKSTIHLLELELDRYGMAYEILVMENGSSDATPEMAKEIARKNPKVRYFLEPNTPGKGKAISEGIRHSKGKFVCFCDADLEIPPEYLPRLVNALKEGYHISVASKRHPESRVSSPIRRTFLSRGYNFFVRMLFRTGVTSHQDGLKAFQRDAVLRVLPFVKDTGWFWDTEVLVISHWLGYRIKEMPIACDYGWESTFDPMSGVGYFLSRLLPFIAHAPSLRRTVRKSSK